MNSRAREQNKRHSHKIKTNERISKVRHGQKNHQNRVKRHRKDLGEEQHQADDEDSEDSEDDDDDELFLSETSDTMGEENLKTQPLPTTNSFLVAAHLTKMKKGTNVQQSKAFVTACGDITMLTLDKKVALKYAGETNFFDVDVPHEHEDDALRQCCGALYARYRYFTENMIAELIPTRHAGHTSGQELTRNHIMKWIMSFQTPIMSTYHKGLKLLVKEMGGKTVWREATIEVRMNVFKRIWNSNKVAMATAMLGRAAVAVPISDIISDKTPAHIEWQIFHRTVFV